MSIRTDVVVVGAGPSGCAAALHLARGGAEVVVVDKASRPRDKCCGEGIMPHGVEELRRLAVLDAVLAAGAISFDSIAYQAGSRRAVASFPDGQGLGLRRLSFDEVLLQATCSEPGVRCLLGTAMEGVEIVPGGVRLSTGAGRILARAVVGADGGPSLVRRQLGLDRRPRGPLRYGGRLHFRLGPGSALPRQVEVHFQPEAELYLTPVGADLVNVAVLCRRDVARSLRGDLPGGLRSMIEGCESLEQLLLGAEPASEALFCGPLRRKASAVVADNALLVGDAAGFLDPITGEGMSIGLVTARLASEVLLPGLASGELSARHLRSYATRRKAAVRDPLRLTRLVLWWAGQPALRDFVVENLARNPESFEKILGVVGGSHSLREAGLGTLRRVAFRY